MAGFAQPVISDLLQGGAECWWMEVQCGSGEAFLDNTDASRWGCLGVWWWWAAVWAGFFLRPPSCWIWENPVLADGTLGFYSLWLFITGLFLVTGDRWWEAVPVTQSSPSLFLRAGAGTPALLPCLCGRLMQAPCCTALYLGETLESPAVWC